MPDKNYDVAIIGGGPAGMAAGLYASRGGLKTIILEKGLKGGPYSITDEIENYPGFPEGIKTEELMDRFDAQAVRFGAEIKNFSPVTTIRLDDKGKTIVLDDGEELLARTVIIASGTSPAVLGAKGEKEFTGRGVSYCATCDGPLFRDKKVLVIGGGNAAVEEAIFLTKFCSSVTIVHRRDKLRADDVLVKRAQANSKIMWIWNSVLDEVRGDMLVTEAVLSDTQTGVMKSVPTDGIFIFVGTSPETGFLADVVERDDKGFVTACDDLQTSVPGVYAAGNCRANSLKQIIWAAAEGARAAVLAEKYIETL